MKMNFIDLKRQYELYKAEIDGAVAEVVSSARYIMGPQVFEMERALGEFVGVEHVISCSSGTDALLLALMALGVGPGDEVITTPFTFIATAETVAFLGAKPVFVDVDPLTFNMDPSLVEGAITHRTKGIIAVSLFGQCPEFDELLEIASRRGLFLLEDGAQSFGARYKGRPSCGITEVAITSFFPAKPLGCFGDGGAVFTSDHGIADRVRMLRNHGQRKRYLHHAIGLNGRMDTVQAAVVLVKLGHFREEIELRQQKARIYDDGLSGLVKTPTVLPHNLSVYAQYTVRAEARDQLKEHLESQGIPIAVHYPIPLHLQPCFGYLGYQKGDFPHAEKAAQEVMSLPMHPYLADSEQEMVIEAVRGFYG